VAGPSDLGAALAADEIQYEHTGPGQFGAYTSSPYPGGRRVLWSNGLDRIVKVDFESFETLATRWVPGAKRYDEARADAAIAGFDASNGGIGAIYRAFREAAKLRDLSSVYTVLGRDNTYFIADEAGTITAYGDADPSDPASAIVVKRSSWRAGRQQRPAQHPLVPAGAGAQLADQLPGQQSRPSAVRRPEFRLEPRGAAGELRLPQRDRGAALQPVLLRHRDRRGGTHPLRDAVGACAPRAGGRCLAAGLWPTIYASPPR
jgi:hypothetical protein